MIAVGIWLGVFGYTTFYYGVKLWAGTPVAFADALGFGANADAGSGAGSSSGGGHGAGKKGNMPPAPPKGKHINQGGAHGTI